MQGDVTGDRKPLESPFNDPVFHLSGYSEVKGRILLKSITECISIDFERNGLVAAAFQESLHVELGEALNAELPVLLDVDEFVKQQSTGERNVGHNHIGERNCLHRGLVRQILDP